MAVSLESIDRFTRVKRSLDLLFIQSQDKNMEFIYFLIATGIAGLLMFIGVMWYDRKHQYDW
jgi:hypothetical protein